VEEYNQGQLEFVNNPYKDRRLRSSGSSGFSRWGSTQELGRVDDDSDDDDDVEPEGPSGRLLGRRQSWGNVHQSITSDAPSEFSFRRRASIAYSEEGEQDVFHDKRITLKKRAISLFVALRELKSYAQLNKTGFTKALKKYDKILQRNLKNAYIEQKVTPAHCFQPSTIGYLDENVNKIVEMYANLVTNGDVEEARKELRLHLREHVVWERNTVWRDMIGIERKAHAAHIGPLVGDGIEKQRLDGDETDTVMFTKHLNTPMGSVRIPTWLFSTGFFTLTAIIVVFAMLLQVKTFDTPEQQNCFAMLVFVSLLWATEVCIPSTIQSFYTSLIRYV